MRLARDAVGRVGRDHGKDGVVVGARCEPRNLCAAS